MFNYPGINWYTFKMADLAHKYMKLFWNVLWSNMLIRQQEVIF